MQQQKGIFDGIDFPALITVFTLMIIGWLAIYSAEFTKPHTSMFDISQSFGRQFLWILTSVGIMSFIFASNYRSFDFIAFPAYAAVILLLVLVYFIAPEVNGERSWLPIGSFKLQPSEFAKLCTALALANYLSRHEVNFAQTRTKLVVAGIIGLPMLLILLQKDEGSALVFGAFIFVLYREGMPGSVLFFGFLALVIAILSLIFNPVYVIIGLLMALLIFALSKRRYRKVRLRLSFVIFIAGVFVSLITSTLYNALESHQQKRIDLVLHKKIDYRKEGYNVRQSMIAIGSGGVIGKGYLQGTQTKFNFVPEQFTDFIFCTIGEEFGFMGSLVLISLFAFLLYRIIVISERQPMKFARIYGYGVASILFFHIMINLGMTIGLFPVIGIPLPFISYGGSSLWSFTILVSILLRLDSRRKLILR